MIKLLVFDNEFFVSIVAVKCNDNLIVIEVLAALGTGFDCASKVIEKIPTHVFLK